MKKKLVVLLVFALMVSITGCSGQKPVESTEDVETSVETSTDKTETNDEQSSNAVDANGAVNCGEVYQYGDLSYNVIGVRTNAYDDGVKYLIVKMEVYNNGLSDIQYTPFTALTMFDQDGVECMFDIMADVDTKLEGGISPENKIMGEAAFEITDSTSNEFVLHIGENFDNYKSAIVITESDIDQTFAEQFENSGIESEYTIGTPVESDQFTITLDSATIEASDKEGKEVVVCNMTVKNNMEEEQSFMLGLNVAGAFAADGSTLDDKGEDITIPMMINGGETVTGAMPFYTNEGTRDFYITVTPDIQKFDEEVNIVFSAE